MTRLVLICIFLLIARGRSESDVKKTDFSSNISVLDYVDSNIGAANTWQGNFPVKNIPEDGYKYAAPVKSFTPNSLGIYDMAGNVWELTQDWFNISYYQKSLDEGEILNPQGAKKSYNPNNSFEKEKVIKGGSFLCNSSYCASYRISARMGQSLDSGFDHAGFRTVVSGDMMDK